MITTLLTFFTSSLGKYLLIGGIVLLALGAAYTYYRVTQSHIAALTAQVSQLEQANQIDAATIQKQAEDAASNAAALATVQANLATIQDQANQLSRQLASTNLDASAHKNKTDLQNKINQAADALVQQLNTATDPSQFVLKVK